MPLSVGLPEILGKAPPWNCLLDLLPGTGKQSSSTINN